MRMRTRIDMLDGLCVDRVRLIGGGGYPHHPALVAILPSGIGASGVGTLPYSILRLTYDSCDYLTNLAVTESIEMRKWEMVHDASLRPMDPCLLLLPIW